jgi:hypothetical protein
MRQCLRGLAYPADRATILEHARRRGATTELLHHLAAMRNRTYEGPNALSEEYLRV